MADIRITFQVLVDDEEVGFGSTSSWDTVASASHDLGTITDRGEWETEPGQPDPETILALGKEPL